MRFIPSWLLYVYRAPDCDLFVCRVCGVGFEATKLPPMFSERIGITTPFMRWRGWRFNWLRR